ncbi:cyclopropane-fatty-acyl-phospholipid synthase [Sphingomonas naasensis]|uniref:Class I SAM-dependent methyltransferase n=1 Tax=Sphingomonas naasensis TaxID=1344951 RepID=A0A4S1WKR1_9SPHN|nr:cyclopropane-fatty-acyl-phospholipid synthase family protein [Sphingomonas naasensis]NIJ21845.1 cyclopropane-fatty-acyl-phospholipid synthase [Sphingomonas naasensis]TGX42457.1 class I SAM-dependent methyltransferase [Sphingomonas naasensis]
MALIDSFFARAVKRGQLTVLHPDGTSRSFGSADPELKEVTIRFGPGAAAAIVRNPSLGAAECFMDGRLTIEQGDILDLLMLMTSNNRWEDATAALDPKPIARLANAIAHRIGRYNMARKAKRNVAHHYDLSRRLYDLFLDADRQYSCAYYTDPDNSLEQAQRDKKAHIVAKLAIEPGMRVLDIGCGWGGLALYIHEKTGAEVVGVTLSEEQLKVARERAAERGVHGKVRFELIDYRAVTGQFDRIVSVGMFEHVGTPQYRTFFRKVRELLTPEGVMLLHTIGRAGAPGVTDAFTLKYIFPGGYIPALSEIVRGYEGLRIFPTDVEVLRLHYAHTLKAWYARTVAAKDEIVALYDERFFRMWTFYLAGSYVAFLNGGLVNYQLQLSRSRTALPITRDYMLEREQALRDDSTVSERLSA